MKVVNVFKLLMPVHSLSQNVCTYTFNNKCMCEVQRRFRSELVIDLPIRITIFRIRENVEAGGTVKDVQK